MNFSTEKKAILLTLPKIWIDRLDLVCSYEGMSRLALIRQYIDNAVRDDVRRVDQQILDDEKMAVKYGQRLEDYRSRRDNDWGKFWAD